MAEIGLDGASVVAVVGELEPAGMPQHVGMHEESEFRGYARPGNHALISGYGSRTTENAPHSESYRNPGQSPAIR